MFHIFLYKLNVENSKVQYLPSGVRTTAQEENCLTVRVRVRIGVTFRVGGTIFLVGKDLEPSLET